MKAILYRGREVSEYGAGEQHDLLECGAWHCPKSMGKDRPVFGGDRKMMFAQAILQLRGATRALKPWRYLCTGGEGSVNR